VCSMNKFKVAFATEFKRCLILRYGKIPSSARIARDFTLASPQNIEPISIETIRKWTNGINLPQSERMHTLAIWLNFDTSKFNNESKLDKSSSLKLSSNDIDKKHSDIAYLVNIYSGINEEHQIIVMQLIELFYQRSLKGMHPHPPPL